MWFTKTLFQAIDKDDEEEVARAVRSGAKLSEPDPGHRVQGKWAHNGYLLPLHYAIDQRRFYAVRALLGCGADPNQWCRRDDSGIPVTPLHLLAGSPISDLLPGVAITELLLQRGANPALLTKDGRTPVDYLLQHVESNIPLEDECFGVLVLLLVYGGKASRIPGGPRQDPDRGQRVLALAGEKANTLRGKQ